MGSSILSILLIPMFLGIFFLVGSLVTCRFQKEEFSVIYTTLIGFFLYFLLFQCIALPMKLLLQPLSLLSVTWLAVLTSVVLISLVVNRKSWRKALRHRKTSGFRAAAVILTVGILIQIIFIINNIQYGSIADASYYIGDTARSVATNTIEQYDQYTGLKRSSLSAIYVLLTYTAHNSVISYSTGIHALVIWRELMGSLVIVLSNLVVYQIARSVLKKNERLSLIAWGFWFAVMFFTYSIYSPSGFLFYRAFEGKTILAVVIIPMMILQMIRSIYSRFENRHFWEAVIVDLGAIPFCMSSMMLLPVVLTIFYIPSMIAFRKKKALWQYLILTGICLAELICYLLFSKGIWRVIVS